MKRKLLFTMGLAVLAVVPMETKRFKVAVAMPKAQQTQFERTAQWALQTIANDDEIIAMIGPKTSVHAKVADSAFNTKEKTLLLPVATSTELQRIYSAKLLAKLSHKYRGLAPSLAPGTEFSEAYHERFGEEPVNTEAAVYDALSLVAYAAVVADFIARVY